MPGLRDESGANSAPQFGANGDVLQVRIGRRQPSGRGSGLPESCVQASARRIDEDRQSVYVSGLELSELTIVEHHASDGMIFREIFKNIDGGRDGPSLAVFHRLRQIHAIEQ